MNRISEHISYREATQSQTAARRGIDNTPSASHLIAMRLVAETCYEPCREHFGVPLAVSSFYRSPKLNAAIGGALTSQHLAGEAIDIDADVFGGVTNKAIFDYLRAYTPFDQLIWEFGTADNPEWVHVSHSATQRRGSVLRAVKVAGKTKYRPYDVRVL